MPYQDSNFSFNPVKAATLNPAKNTVGGNDSPLSVNQSLYVPTCNSTSLLKEVYHNQVAAYANNYGMPITYFPVKYNYSKANFIYGEDKISGFHVGRVMKAVIDFASYSSFLTKFGMMSDADITITIPIREFSKIWGDPAGEGIYPLAGDVFYINDSACDRPLQQSPMVFEIADKEDKIKPVDYMGGHYVWKLTAKRADYDYMPNMPEERFLDSEASDSKEHGRMPGGDNVPDMSYKAYDVDDFAKKEYDNIESSIYGKYL